MGWVRRLPSGAWAGRFRDADGRERTAPGGPYPHKAAALRAAGEAEAAARAPGWRSPDAALATWGQWCQEWWPTRTVEASTLRTDVGRRDLHLMPRWGDVPLVDITRHDIRAWAAGLREGRTVGTVQRCVHLLSASLAAAVDAEILTANPAARLRLGGGHDSPERFLTREEFAAVVEELEAEHAVMARLLVGTGLRWGEAAGLHWARVDVERGVLVVAEVWSMAGRVMKGYPKGRRRRQVPVPGWVGLHPPPPGPGGGCGYPHAGGGVCRSGLVVSTARGAVLDESRFRRVWDAACSAVGVGHVRPHDLRHTYASWLLQAGVSLAEVGRLLGHVSPVTTQRYAHLAETPSVAVLGALWEPGRDADVTQGGAQLGYPVLRLVKGEGS